MSKKLKKSSLQMAAEAAEAYVPVDEDFVLDVDQDIQTDKNYASQGFWKGVITRFFKNARAVIGLVIIVLIIILAIIGPHTSGHGYAEVIKVESASGKKVLARSLPPRVPGLHKLFTGE